MEKNIAKPKAVFLFKMLPFILGFGFLIICAIVAIMLLSFYTAKSNIVAIVPIVGEITTDRATGFGASGASSKEIVEQIKDASEDDRVVALILDINSPGGSPVASDEIAKAIKKTNKTTIAVIREVGASGAYWIASSADKVYANRMSVTGSIGVIRSYLEFADFIKEYNITQRRLVAGKYKDVGDPFRKMTAEEEALFQKQLDKLHEIFINEVAANRKLPVEKVKELATGFIYLGDEAKELGLIDEIGGIDDAREFIEREKNMTVDIEEYTTEIGIMELFFGAIKGSSYSIGQGMGDSLMKESLFDFR